MRRLLLLAALLLVITACSSDDETAGTTSTAAPATTQAAPTTTTSPPATTAAPPATSTTAAPTTTTTTTTIAPAPGLVGMARVVFAPVPYVLLTNVGQDPINLGDHWLCQRPAYIQLPEFILEGGDTVAVGLGTEEPPDLAGLAGVIDLGPALGAIDAAAGELGLYLAAEFGSPDAISDYVEWGAPGGGRESVAVEAGIWVEGAFVDVPAEALSISSSGLPGAGPDDWFSDLGG